MGPAFVTGSRACGAPRNNSDVDLVILASPEDIDILAGQAVHVEAGSGEALGNVSLRFGSLNLICLTDAADYQIWRKGTAALKARKPMHRQLAVAEFDRRYEKLRKYRESVSSQSARDFMGVTVSLAELVRVPGTRRLWPQEFEGLIAKLETNPDEKTQWGVVADWLRENGEPGLADAFRWIASRADIYIRLGAYQKGRWAFGSLPLSLSHHHTEIGFCTETIPGAVAAVGHALAKARAEINL